MKSVHSSFLELTCAGCCRYSSWGGHTGPTSCSLPSTSLSALTSRGSTALPQQWPAACSSWVHSPTATAMPPLLQTPSTTSTCRTSRPVATAKPQLVKKRGKFMLFSDHNGGLLKRQPGTMTIGHSSACMVVTKPCEVSQRLAIMLCWILLSVNFDVSVDAGAQ